MSKRPLPSPQEQVVTAELLLLRSLGAYRRQASWKMALNRQSAGLAGGKIPPLKTRSVIGHMLLPPAPLKAAPAAGSSRKQATRSRQGAADDSPRH
jgi:hypothetical protein